MTTNVVEQAREIRRQLRNGEIRIEADHSVSVSDYYYNRMLQEAMDSFTSEEAQTGRIAVLEHYALPIVQKFDILSSDGCVKRVKLDQDLKSLVEENRGLKDALNDRDRRLKDANDQLNEKDARIRFLEETLTKNKISYGSEQGEVA